MEAAFFLLASVDDEETRSLTFSTLSLFLEKLHADKTLSQLFPPTFHLLLSRVLLFFSLAHFKLHINDTSRVTSFHCLLLLIPQLELRSKTWIWAQIFSKTQSILSELPPRNGTLYLLCGDARKELFSDCI